MPVDAFKDASDETGTTSPITLKQIIPLCGSDEETNTIGLEIITDEESTFMLISRRKIPKLLAPEVLDSHISRIRCDANRHNLLVITINIDS